jgi:uncharacterized protein YcbK (DUF882 family)
MYIGIPEPQGFPLGRRRFHAFGVCNLKMLFLNWKRAALVVAAIALAFASASASHADEIANSATPEQYRLHLHHLHTGESIDVVYRIGDRYLLDAVQQLDHFLRDHRTGDVAQYDPREFDLLHSIVAKLGRPDATIDIVCGYRTPWSNNFLRSRSSGVAEHSQHMLGKAIDIRIPGFSTTQVREAALSLHAGGVGYYPVSQFVHVDVGPLRQWQFGSVPSHAGR